MAKKAMTIIERMQQADLIRGKLRVGEPLTNEEIDFVIQAIGITIGVIIRYEDK